MLLLHPYVKPRDQVVGTVYGEEDGAHVPVFFLVVRGDCAGFVFEIDGADFFEVVGDGSDLEAVEAALRRAEAVRAERRAGGGRPEAGAGGAPFPR